MMCKSFFCLSVSHDFNFRVSLCHKSSWFRHLVKLPNVSTLLYRCKMFCDVVTARLNVTKKSIRLYRPRYLLIQIVCLLSTRQRQGSRLDDWQWPQFVQFFPICSSSYSFLRDSRIAFLITPRSWSIVLLVDQNFFFSLLGTRGHVEKRWPTAVVLMLQLGLNEFAHVSSIDKTFWNLIWKIKFIFPFWRLL
jgi:hypothetical protein